MKRAVEDGLALLAGAGVGMAVMYLLDPDNGRNRRARISRTAADALEQSGEYLGAATGMIGSGASSLTGRIGDRFSDATDSLSDAAHSARRMISREPQHWWERAGDSARRLLHRGSNRAENWYDSGSSCWDRGAVQVGDVRERQSAALAATSPMNRSITMLA